MDYIRIISDHVTPGPPLFMDEKKISFDIPVCCFFQELDN